MSLSFRKVFFIAAFFCWLLSFLWISTMARAEIEDPTNGEWSNPEHPLVLELFTATNCSACMVSDRLLYDMSKDPNVIALSCHVKYWDENTLRDPTGLEACTYRQWAYQSSGRMDKTDIKIPYLVVDGNENITAERPQTFYSRVRDARARSVRLPLWVKMAWGAKDKVHVTLPDAPKDFRIDLKDSFSVWLIRYEDFIIQRVRDGDGNNRVLRFSNVVRKAKHIAKWHGESRTIEISVPEPPGGNEKGGYAVLIHEMNGSDIYAAGKLPDYDVDKKKAKKKPKETQPE